MKHFGKLALLGAALAVSASLTATAHATTYTLNGSAWDLPTFYNVPATGSSVYTSTPTATFTVSNSSATNLINFNSQVGSNNSADYTLSSFLTSGGDALTYVTGSGAGSDLLNATSTNGPCSGSGMSQNCATDFLFQFTGTTTLTTGSYNFESDDGIILYLTGGILSNYAAINAPAPTAATLNTFCVGSGSGCVAAGTYSFALDYAEVDGPPAVLTTNLPLGTPSGVPEPSSLMLLGTGLLSAAGMLMRRRRLTA
jgi:hypothetical protein